MDSIVARTIARLRAKYPESADRWSDADLLKVVHLCDMLVREQCETLWSEVEITLTEGALYYALYTSLIWVGTVQFSLDGTTFKDGVLRQVTLAEMDEADPRWPERTGPEPTLWMPMSMPGVKNYSKIMLWPKMTAVTAEKVRVRGLACYPSANISMAAATEERGLIDAIYVPLASAMLTGTIRPDEATRELQKALRAMPEAYGRYQSKNSDWYAPWDLNDHRLR